MNARQWLAIIRSVLLCAGSILVTMGLMDEDTGQQVAGGLMGALALLLHMEPGEPQA